MSGEANQLTSESLQQMLAAMQDQNAKLITQLQSQNAQMLTKMQEATAMARARACRRCWKDAQSVGDVSVAVCRRGA